jgi:chaperonin GroES
MATIYPLGDRLKVLPLRRPESTRGGILMPETSEERERPKEGIVLAVGVGRCGEYDGAVRYPLECEVGDVVQFGKYAGIVVFDDEVGFDVLLMREDEALGRKRRDELPAEIEGDPRLAATKEAEARAGLAQMRAELLAKDDGVPKDVSGVPILEP